MIRLNNKKVLARQRKIARYAIKDWIDRLAGYPAFILGNGPSISDQPINLLKDYFTIGINRIHLLNGFDPTILMWQDIGLWNTEHQRIHNLQCLKICRDISDPRHIYYNFYLRGGPFRFERKTHILNGRGSSGPLAVELAVALGCKPIVILGMDCKSIDGKTNFYGNNVYHSAFTKPNCVKGLEFIKSECPVPIINCSNNDVFTESHQLSDVLSRIDTKYAIGRQRYVSKLVHNKS